MNVIALRNLASAPVLPAPDGATRYRIAHAASFAADPAVHLMDCVIQVEVN
jgi:hypothetical protein